MARNTGTQYLLLTVGLIAALGAQEYKIVDIQSVPLSGDPLSAVVRIKAASRVREVTCDVLIAGAGMGGIGAALAASGRGHSVCLTDETDWVGGQATSGGVSALDENRFIEFAGGTRRYMEFRKRLRDWYRTNYRLSAAAAAMENFNPGSCYVSPLCFEPRAGVAVLNKMLETPGVVLYLRTQIVAVERKGAKIVSALAWQFDKRESIRFRPRFVLDATEMGDLLPLAKVPYVVGAESRADTREPDAAETPNPGCVQSFTYPFVLEHESKPGPAVARPPDYARILERQNFSLHADYPTEFGWRVPFDYHMFGEDPPIPNNMSPGPFFTWRRLLAARNFASGVDHDIALINWPHQDYAAESPLDRTPEELAAIMQRAKQTSMAFLHWLQTNVPRDGGSGTGYRLLKLRPDEMGTADGLSKYPYIRESRRIVARGRVTEQDIIEDSQPGPRAKLFDDSIGVGFYMVDIHPCGANERGRMRMPRPFQIPMSALLPRDVENFLPAGKNIGVTHLTNGAYRLHPVEWNIGEAAGTMASLWIETGSIEARAVQEQLARQGVPLFWFDDIDASDPSFGAIQMAAVRGVYPIDAQGLHASPSAPVTRAEAALTLAAYFGKRADRSGAIEMAVHEGWMAVDHRNWFHPDLPFYWTDWREDKFPSRLPPLKSHTTGPVRRAELAVRLTGP